MADYVGELRKLVGTRLLYLPGVRAIIVNDRGEILLQRRTDTGTWGLPSGSCELEDSALSSLFREVDEETALEVTAAEPMALYSGPGQRVTYPHGDEIQCFSLVFVVRKWTGTPVADGVEGSELGWFAPDALPDDTVEIHKETVADYLAWDGKFMVK
ncbi:MAG: NUDIX domain-containing protein [Candidatus Glassbacteria bacterium]|nr:NUDIX domain-containing protein [Candidatus Glassbacteria bacterium]